MWQFTTHTCDKQGQEKFAKNYSQYGIDTIWGWGKDSGILPCRVYLRHCVLAAEKQGQLDSFLDETYLADRVTTIREHLAKDPTIMQEKPPPALVARYSG